jgi:hypothetical protein
MFVGSVLVLGVLVATGLPRLVRVGLFVPLLFGSLGWFQARSGTCVALAGQDRMDLDDGPEPVRDAYVRAVLRRQSRNVWLQAFLAAAVGTALALAA